MNYIVSRSNVQLIYELFHQSGIMTSVGNSDVLTAFLFGSSAYLKNTAIRSCILFPIYRPFIYTVRYEKPNYFFLLFLEFSL